MDWKSIRKNYEKDGLPVAELARRYGCHQSTIRRRAKKEGWSRKARKGGLEPEELDPRLCMLHEHRKLWKDVKKRLSMGLEKGSMDDIKVAKTACDALSSLMKGEREVWGLDEIDYGGGLDEAMEIAAEMDTATVPPGTGASLEGEETFRSGAGRQKKRKNGTGKKETRGGSRGK